MKLADYKKEDFKIELEKRVKDICQRERIVIKFPFGCKIKRVELYCSETEPKTNGYFGEPFDGIFSLQEFQDYSNKPTSKGSYSYKTEFLNYLPKFIDKCYELANLN